MLLLYPTCRRNIKRPQPDSHTTQKLGRVSQPLPAGNWEIIGQGGQEIIFFQKKKNPKR